MARTIINNKQVFQSYVLTTAKYDFSPYEKRIMYRLIELAQKEIEGIKLKDNLRKIAPNKFRQRNNHACIGHTERRTRQALRYCQSCIQKPI